jgi:RNA polymerase sigma factor (TIGR02999 family)
MASDAGDITRILADIRGADRKDAFDRLFPLVYAELRATARARLRRERPDHTLDATALVHEAYLRLLGGAYPTWNDRQHFFRAAAEAMRRILVEHARRRARVKRGANPIHVTLGDAGAAAAQHPADILALDAAICRLEGQDPTSADIVRLRFFAGLSVEETARMLDVSERTVKRQWAFARAWLFQALGGVGTPKPED